MAATVVSTSLMGVAVSGLQISRMPEPRRKLKNYGCIPIPTLQMRNPKPKVTQQLGKGARESHRDPGSSVHQVSIVTWAEREHAEGRGVLVTGRWVEGPETPWGM